MKIQLNVSKLKEFYKVFSVFITKQKKGVEVSSTKLFLQIEKGILHFIMGDSSYYIKITYGPVTGVEQGEYFVDSAAFNLVCKYCSSEEVELTFKENHLFIKELLSKDPFEDKLYYYAGTHPKNSMGGLLTIPESPCLCIESKELMKILNFLLPAIPQDVARTPLRGVKFDGTGTAVALDGSKLLGLYKNTKESSNLFLFSESFDLLNALPETNQLFIYDCQTKVYIKSENIEMIIPQVSNSFPDYSKIFDHVYLYNYSFPRIELVRTFEKLVGMSDQFQRYKATMTLHPTGTISLQAMTSEIGGSDRTLTPIHSIHPEESIDIYISTAAIREACRSFTAETLHLKISNNPLSPIIITDKDNCTYYILTLSISKR